MRFQLPYLLICLAAAVPANAQSHGPASAASRRAPAAPAARPIAIPPLPPGLQCRQAIHAAERARGVPLQLMAAIARVESGRPDARGVIHPWPWTINAEGAGQYFESRDAAVAAVRSLLARGVRSIDVGCMQVNLAYHPAAFATLEQAFDPAANAAYAARYLNELYAQTRDWNRAAATYHSATPERAEGYLRKVIAVWPEEHRRLRDTPLAAPGHVWSRHAFTANMWNTPAPALRPAPIRPRG